MWRYVSELLSPVWHCRALCDHTSPLAYSFFSFPILFLSSSLPSTSSISTSASLPMTYPAPPTNQPPLFSPLLSVSPTASCFTSIHHSVCVDEVWKYERLRDKWEWRWRYYRGRRRRRRRGEETYSIRDFTVERAREESVIFPPLSPSPPPSLSLSLSLSLSRSLFASMCVLVCASPVSPGSAVVRRRHRWAGKRRESGCIWPKENGRSLDRHARLTSGSDHQRLSLTLALSFCLSLSFRHTHRRTHTRTNTHTCALRLTHTH